MNEIIEIKRKEYEVIEQIGEHSFKVERKGQFFFLKKFEDDPAGFEKFIDAEHSLRVSGVSNPKCFIYDKKLRIAVLEYVEGETCFDKLLKEDLPESVIELLFKTFWYARNDRYQIVFNRNRYASGNGDRLFTNSRHLNGTSFIVLPNVCQNFAAQTGFAGRFISHQAL